jgi:tetrahydromethanopterin S-methyltransferase subunit C
VVIKALRQITGVPDVLVNRLVNHRVVAISVGIVVGDVVQLLDRRGVGVTIMVLRAIPPLVIAARAVVTVDVVAAGVLGDLGVADVVGTVTADEGHRVVLADIRHRIRNIFAAHVAQPSISQRPLRVGGKRRLGVIVAHQVQNEIQQALSHVHRYQAP